MAATEDRKTDWGRRESIGAENGCELAIVHINPGASLEPDDTMRREHCFVIEGVAELVEGPRRRKLRRNEAFDLIPELGPTLLNRSDEALRVLAVHFPNRPDVGGNCSRNRDLTPPVVICEIGCNHKGDLGLAIEMIKVAAVFCKTDCVKFQKRCNRELLSPDEYSSPHPNPANSYGSTYGEHREFLEFDLDQHRILKRACEDWGVVYSASVWDVTSAREIASLNPQFIKIPSAINTNMPVLDVLFREYKGQIHVSLGMTREDEVETLLHMAETHDRSKDLVLYHCISGYPVDERDLALGELPILAERYAGKFGALGFSGHHRGIAADIAALALGAEFFERHFTLDRTWKGTDHAASVEPDGIRRLVRDLKEISEGLKPKRMTVLPVEEEQRKKLKKFESLGDGAVG